MYPVQHDQYNIPPHPPPSNPPPTHPDHYQSDQYADPGGGTRYSYSAMSASSRLSTYPQQHPGQPQAYYTQDYRDFPPHPSQDYLPPHQHVQQQQQQYHHPHPHPPPLHTSASLTFPSHPSSLPPSPRPPMSARPPRPLPQIPGQQQAPSPASTLGRAPSYAQAQTDYRDRDDRETYRDREPDRDAGMVYGERDREQERDGGDVWAMAPPPPPRLPPGAAPAAPPQLHQQRYYDDAAPSPVVPPRLPPVQPLHPHRPSQTYPQQQQQQQHPYSAQGGYAYPPSQPQSPAPPPQQQQHSPEDYRPFNVAHLRADLPLARASSTGGMVSAGSGASPNLSYSNSFTTTHLPPGVIGTPVGPVKKKRDTVTALSPSQSFSGNGGGGAFVLNGPPPTNGSSPESDRHKSPPPSWQHSDIPSVTVSPSLHQHLSSPSSARPSPSSAGSYPSPPRNEWEDHTPRHSMMGPQADDYALSRQNTTTTTATSYAHSLSTQLGRTGSSVSSVLSSPLPPAVPRVDTGERLSLVGSQRSSGSANGSFEFVQTPTPTGSAGGPDLDLPPRPQHAVQDLAPPSPAVQQDEAGYYGESEEPTDDGEEEEDLDMVSEYSSEEVLGDIKHPGGPGLALHHPSAGGPDGAGYYPDEEDYEIEEDEDRFVNLALLSHAAVRLRDTVPRGTHVKGSIPYQRAFTGKDIVTTLQTMIQHYLLSQLGISTHDRSLGLMVARSLHHQLFFYEVEWGGQQLSDSVEDVFMFLDDFDAGGTTSGQPGGAAGGGVVEREELPTGVVTMFTSCYSPTCIEPGGCYAYGCPRRNHAQLAPPSPPSQPSLVEEPRDGRVDWRQTLSHEFLQTLPESEIKRQDIILNIIKKEELYNEDLNLLETLFLKPLRSTRSTIMPSDQLDDFIDDVFGNFYDLRECSRRLLDVLKVRQREQYPVIQKIGDIFLNSATEFRQVYPIYVGHLPVAEKRLKDEMDRNPDLRLFLEQCARNTAARRMDLKLFITRPSEHLQRYPDTLQALLQETVVGSPDGDYLFEALQAIRRLHSVAALMTFQSAMLRGVTAKLEWHDLLPEGTLQEMDKHEVKRQSQIFELIKGEMEYIKDLETIETLFIRRLRTENIVAKDRVNEFVHDIFWNYQELHKHHRRMLDKLHEIQREEFPVVYSIVEPVFDAALNWRDAYMEYIPHYPIAVYKLEREMETNPQFRDFVEQCVRHPDARKLDIKAFVLRPVPRLMRYTLLLEAIQKSSPPDHTDRVAIPQLMEIITALIKATQAGVASTESKVKLWQYSHNLLWKENGPTVDLQLMDETRSLVHSGKLLRQPDTGFEWTGWTELFVLLFDNYLVMTKPKETKEGIVKYIVRGRPIPLELLALTNFTEVPQQRSVGILRGKFRGDRTAEPAGPNGTLGAPAAQDSADPRFVYPFTIYNSARESGFYTLYAETQQARQEWKDKLEEALGLRGAVQENNKVLEIETLSMDTFIIPPTSVHAQTTWSEENSFTGRVTCSVPFSTPDGRGLIAVGCAEGVWIGLRHDSRSLRRVLALKQVTQCAMLEKFGIFLVLADKTLYAYLLEALVPTSATTVHAARQPERLNKDVVFFSVGQLGDRTLITYMKKKGMDSVFQVVEPVLEKIQEKTKPVGAFGRFMSGAKSEWFRSYREFFLPSDAYDVYFLRLKIVILCQKGFEIMGLADFKSDTIPHRDDPKWGPIAKRFEACRPIGIFRTSSEEFLLCYDEFGIYVGRHGDPSRGDQGVVEWEGKPLRAAFHPPYVLLFDQRFIEIRHIAKLHLVQIIPGTDIRCIYDGRASDTTPQIDPGPQGYAEGTIPQDSRVHAVMKAPNPPSGNQRGGIAQHVFELVPTIPLYVPEPLGSPSGSVYYGQDSPPHSPQLQASSLGWR